MRLRWWLGSFFLFFLCLGGCQRHETSSWWEENGKIKALATTGMVSDMVREVGGEEVEVLCLIQGALDPHSYELIKGDSEKFERAEVVFYNGLGLEHGLSLRRCLENHPCSVPIAQKLLHKTGALLYTEDGRCDPHVWMDISLWKETIDPIVETLTKICPEKAAVFRDRGEQLKTTMEKKDQEAVLLLHSVPPHKRYLVTGHDAFRYFTRRYLAEPEEKEWRVRCKAPEGLSPDAQLSVADILALVDHIVRYKVQVLFPESNLSQDALRKIAHACAEKKCPVSLEQSMLYGDAMGEATSYLDMIWHNVETIFRALGGENETGV